MTQSIGILEISFLLITALSLFLFYLTHKNIKIILGILLWMLPVGILGYMGFYRDSSAFPPRFLFLLGPVVIFVLLLFFFPKSKRFAHTLDLKWLNLLHIVRVPVELVLFGAFVQGLIPDLMTFEGYNLDILSGITAPFVYYLVFVKRWWGYKALFIWNVACLGLLINILTIAVLSAQTPFQQLAFDQPNIGVTLFPYVWLPTVVVPIVLYAQLVGMVRSFERMREAG